MLHTITIIVINIVFLLVWLLYLYYYIFDIVLLFPQRLCMYS